MYIYSYWYTPVYMRTHKLIHTTAAFDCRGLEPISCELGSGFVVTSVGGTKFEDVDVSDDWYVSE